MAVIYFTVALEKDFQEAFSKVVPRAFSIRPWRDKYVHILDTYSKCTSIFIPMSKV